MQRQEPDSESADSEETIVSCDCKIEYDAERTERLSVRKKKYQKLQRKTKAQKRKIKLLEAQVREKKKTLRLFLHRLLEEI